MSRYAFCDHCGYEFDVPDDDQSTCWTCRPHNLALACTLVQSMTPIYPTTDSGIATESETA